jgi:hypothetical protein
MSPDIIAAGKLYVTDRKTFTERYGESLHADYLDMLFMESETRPLIAEQLALLILGHTPLTIKKYDGKTDTGRFVEAKCRTLKSTASVLSKRAFANITAADVSQAIVDRYDADNPLFVFPFFIDGHLAAVFTVDYTVIAPKYKAKLAKPGKGRVSVTLSQKDWLHSATMAFVNSDPEVVKMLPKKMRDAVSQKD